MAAKQFCRHSTDTSDVTLSLLGCPVCGGEMNFELSIRTVMGAIYSPYVAASTRMQCGKCGYYERVGVDAKDNDSIKAVEAHALQFIEKLPGMARWTRSRVTNGKYQYRSRRKGALNGKR